MTAGPWPRPQFGDVVWCRFPYGGEQTMARHPCLVLYVSADAQGQAWLMLAGGSSSNKSGNWERLPASTDLLVQGKYLQAAGLQHATAFHFEAPQCAADGSLMAGTVMTLPYTEDYFLAVHPAVSPRAGRLEILTRAPLREAFAQAAKNANLCKMMKQEKQRFAKAPI